MCCFLIYHTILPLKPPAVNQIGVSRRKWRMDRRSAGGMRNKNALPINERARGSFHNPDRLGFSPVYLAPLMLSPEGVKLCYEAVSTGIAPSANNVTLLLSTSTKPPCISKKAK